MVEPATYTANAPIATATTLRAVTNTVWAVVTLLNLPAATDDGDAPQIGPQHLGDFD